MALVRPATVADAGGIARVHVEGWRSSYAGLLPAAYLATLDPGAREQMWRESLAEPDERRGTFVAEADDGTVVGFVSVCRSRDPDAPAGTAEVRALYLRPASQRCGVGTALLHEALHHLTERGFVWVTLLVLEGNVDARAFYEARGFAFDGTRVPSQIGGCDVVQLRYAVPLP